MTTLIKLLEKIWHLGLLATILLVLVFWLFRPADDLAARKTSDASRENVLVVETLKVTSQNHFEFLEHYSGRVVPRRTSELGFQLSGRVDEVLVDDGSKVKKSDVLAKLSIRHLLDKRSKQESHKASLVAQMAGAEARLALAKATAMRRKKLLAKHNVSKQALDEAEQGESASQARLAAAIAAIAEADAEIRMVETEIHFSSLRAPFDGTIVSVLANEGTGLELGQPVMRVIEDGVLIIRMQIPEQSLKILEHEQDHTIKIDDRRYTVRLHALIPGINPVTRTGTALFVIKNPDSFIKAGQIASLTLKRRRPGKGFWVPMSALTEGRRGMWRVYVLEATDQKNLFAIKPRDLQLLHAESEQVYVRGTITEGERVVADGVHRVVPGQFVTIK